MPCSTVSQRLVANLRVYEQAKHANGEHSWGINGDTGKIVDMKAYGLYESASVKIQTLKTAIEVRLRLHPLVRRVVLNVCVLGGTRASTCR